MIDDDIPGGPMVWHSGGAAGYGTFLARFTAEGLSIAAMCDFEPVSTTSLAGRVADMFLPPVDPQAERPGPVAAPGVDVTGRAGLFVAEGTGEPLRLVLNGGRLSIAGAPPLVPVSADRFRPSRITLYARSEDNYDLTFRSNDEFELTSMEGQTTRYSRAQPWMPTAADLQAVDGRYESQELGTVFEILPGANGVVMRFERSPEQALELEPVAHDTYMRGMAIIRFHRDGSGNVTGFDYGNPMVRAIAFTRLGDRAESARAVPAQRPRLSGWKRSWASTRWPPGAASRSRSHPGLRARRRRARECRGDAAEWNGARAAEGAVTTRMLTG